MHKYNHTLLQIRRKRLLSEELGVRATKFMIINSENYMMGNKAMASVLLLYYHLMNEGAFCGDETVFLDTDEFDGFNFLDVKIEDGYETDIDEKLIRQGAVIYLLCDLNDMITEHEECFLSLDITKKIISRIIGTPIIILLSYFKNDLTLTTCTSSLWFIHCLRRIFNHDTCS